MSHENEQKTAEVKFSKNQFYILYNALRDPVKTTIVERKVSIFQKTTDILEVYVLGIKN